MGWGRGWGKPAYGNAVGIFTFPDGVLDGQEAAYVTAVGNLSISGWGGEGSGEASLCHCGKNLYVSGCGAGGLGGKPAYGTAVGILTSPDGVREGSGEASLRHCGRNLYVLRGGYRREASLWHCGKIFLHLRMGWGRARGKPAYGTAVGIFTSPDVVREG